MYESVRIATTLSQHINRALIWQNTKEGRKYWADFRNEVRNNEDKNAALIFKCLPSSDIWGYPQPDRDAKAYKHLQILARYYYRFGQLPALALFKELL